MNSTIENFKKYKPLLFELVSRDLKTKYRRSVLGVLWTVLNPLGMMLVMTVVFSTVFRQNIENFPVYLMCGQLVFNFFNEASNGKCLTDQEGVCPEVFVPTVPCVFKSGQHADILYSADHCYHCYPDTGDLDDHHSGISGFVCQYVCVWCWTCPCDSSCDIPGSAASVWCCDHGMAVSDTDLLSDFHAAGVDRTPYQAESDHVVCGIVALCCFI